MNYQIEDIDVHTNFGIVTVSLPSEVHKMHFAAIAAALTTTFINTFVVDQLSRFLVQFESYETYSLYTVSLASKLSVMLFINSAIIAFLANTYFTGNLFGPGGLIYTEFYFFLSNAVATPLVNLVDSNLVLKKIQIWYLKRKGKNAPINQKKLNELLQYPEHEIELRYADIMKTLFITLFYAPLIPCGYIISFICLSAYYWVEKYVLLRRQCVRHTPSAQLSILMTELLEYLPVIYALSNIIFKYQICGYLSTVDMIAGCVAILNAVIPMQTLVETFFPPKEEDETTTYDEAKINFITDYDIENPITKYLIREDAYNTINAEMPLSNRIQNQQQNGILIDQKSRNSQVPSMKQF